MVDLESDDFAEIAEEDPEMMLNLLGAFFNERNIPSKTDVMKVFGALSKEGVNVPRLMREHPEATREAFGDSMPMPNDELIEAVERLGDME